jgi:hypothetical protein
MQAHLGGRAGRGQGKGGEAAEKSSEYWHESLQIVVLLPARCLGGQGPHGIPGIYEETAAISPAGQLVHVSILQALAYQVCI